MCLLLHLFILGDMLLPELGVGGLVIKQWIGQCEMIYKVAPKITVTVRKLAHLYRAAGPSQSLLGWRRLRTLAVCPYFIPSCSQDEGGTLSSPTYYTDHFSGNGGYVSMAGMAESWGHRAHGNPTAVHLVTSVLTG